MLCENRGQCIVWTVCGQCVDSGQWQCQCSAGRKCLSGAAYILSVLWYCSLISPSLFPTLAPTARPGHPARDTTLADSTNRVRLATLSVVSSSVPSQATQVSSQATLAVAVSEVHKGSRIITMQWVRVRLWTVFYHDQTSRYKTKSKFLLLNPFVLNLY